MRIYEVSINMPKKKLTKAQEKKDVQKVLNTINRLIENKLYYPHDMNSRVSLKGLMDQRTFFTRMLKSVK
jgi:hypothetical protein